MLPRSYATFFRKSRNLSPGVAVKKSRGLMIRDTIRPETFQNLTWYILNHAFEEFFFAWIWLLVMKVAKNDYFFHQERGQIGVKIGKKCESLDFKGCIFGLSRAAKKHKKRPFHNHQIWKKIIRDLVTLNSCGRFPGKRYFTLFGGGGKSGYFTCFLRPRK